ncbi:hypothetical protein AB0E82_39520 [Streptomyces anulatus]|uniref:hypothetical protein n=1 Tax=Streptomyces anulatus TaxID=1892 RepID=UPI0033FA008F
MSPQERLDAILREERFRFFPPFGAANPGSSGRACLCFSECPPGHLDHLVSIRGFAPWGLVGTRETVNRLGGGTVAYVPPEVHETFQRAGLGHWAVRTAERSTWLHEREWRIPSSPTWGGRIDGVMAILIADATWRPTQVPTGRWVDGETGLEVAGPGATNAIEVHDYPRLWRESRVWVWDREKRNFDEYAPGELH